MSTPIGAWFPRGEGREYQFTETLKPLEGKRDKLTILGGFPIPRAVGWERTTLPTPS